MKALDTENNVASEMFPPRALTMSLAPENASFWKKLKKDTLGA